MIRHPLIAILALGLVLRLAAAFVVTNFTNRAERDFLIPGDADGYWILAGQIAEGEDYAVYDPPRRVMRMPGFPAVLAVSRFVVGDSLLAARIVLALVGTAGAGAVYLLGRALISTNVGLIAGLLAAIHPVFVGFSVVVLSETLFALGLTLSLAGMAEIVRRVLDKPSFTRCMGWGALTGLSIALTSYVRPTWLPAAVLFPLVLILAVRSRRSWLIAATVVLTAALSLAPWVWRNHAVTGRWIVTTLWVGPSLYDGLRPGATGASDMRFFENDRLLERMSEYQMDQTYRARSWKFARENPWRVVELAAIKLWRYWRPWPGAPQFATWPARITVATSFLSLGALAVMGVWAKWEDAWLIGLTIAPIVLFSLVHCVFVGSLRYRLPAEYPLCVLSAAGAQWLFHRRNAKTPQTGIVHH